MTTKVKRRIVDQKKKKKLNTPTNSVANYRRGMKLIPIYVDYCLLHFDALISQTAWIQIITTFLTFVIELLDTGIVTNASF